jgi:hypothetical protein
MSKTNFTNVLTGMSFGCCGFCVELKRKPQLKYYRYVGFAPFEGWTQSYDMENNSTKAI